ncbi:hypothetical protein AMR41_14305 [Hapalosiphon sp. MRB220]|nr:hypothetical protein AMR41_14305 [Hapalosiphon sp. MRB220]
MSTIKELKAQASALGITPEQAKQYGKLSSKAAWERVIAEVLSANETTVEQASVGTNTYEPETLSSPWDEVSIDDTSYKPCTEEVLPTNKPLLLLPPAPDHTIINIDESVPGSVYTPVPTVERADLEDFSLDIEPLGVSNKPQPRKRNMLGTLKTIAECAYWFGVGFMRGLEKASVAA